MRGKAILILSNQRTAQPALSELDVDALAEAASEGESVASAGADFVATETSRLHMTIFNHNLSTVNRFTLDRSDALSALMLPNEDDTDDKTEEGDESSIAVLPLPVPKIIQEV